MTSRNDETTDVAARMAALEARLADAERRASDAEKRAATSGETGARQWAGKAIPEAMTGFTAWIEATYPELFASLYVAVKAGTDETGSDVFDYLPVTASDDVAQRLVTVASKAYRYYQATR